MLDMLVLTSSIQRTSQRVKWTSGAWDMIFCPWRWWVWVDHFFPDLETLAGDNGGGAGTFWLDMISSPEMIKAGMIFWECARIAQLDVVAPCKTSHIYLRAWRGGFRIPASWTLALCAWISIPFEIWFPSSMLNTQQTQRVMPYNLFGRACGGGRWEVGGWTWAVGAGRREKKNMLLSIIEIE